MDMIRINEEAVFLQLGPNILQGIYHVPEKKCDKKIGILFCNAGLTYNIGVARLYVRMARSLSARGFHVLRFDPKGTGDSDGSFEKTLINDLFNNIENGLFVNDTLAMFDHFLKISPIKSIIIVGFCGGGVTAILTASHRFDKTSGVFTAGIPIWDRETYDQHLDKIMPKDLAKKYRDTYLKKILDVEAWKRFLTAKTDFKLLFKVLTFRTGSKKQYDSKDFLRGEVPGVNNKLAVSFCHIADKRIPVLFVYGTNDKAQSFFEEYFLSTFLNPKGPYKDSYQYEIIENGDHNFCLPDAQDKVMKVILDWTQRF